MTKKFIKDNRGQVLYAVLVAVIFIGVLSMITMGLTLKNYQAAVQKQQRVRDYYAADAVAELIRIGAEGADVNETAAQWGAEVSNIGNVYTIKTDTATIVTTIEDNQFKSWEVSYHAAETEANDQAQDPAT